MFEEKKGIVDMVENFRKCLSCLFKTSKLNSMVLAMDQKSLAEGFLKGVPPTTSTGRVLQKNFNLFLNKYIFFIELKKNQKRPPSPEQISQTFLFIVFVCLSL